MPEPNLRLVPASDCPNTNDQSAIVVTRFPCVLGRNARCDEHIDHLMISRQHCEFTLRDGRIWVEDLGSRHGTCLNGRSLTGAEPIAEGDVLHVAHLSFQVQLQDAPDTFLASDLPPMRREEGRPQAWHDPFACGAAVRP
jgi:pSer/pThr/pTyr-binding forkhead associated (FHA) protein